MEIWKDIEEYNGLYKVSDYGRVKSLAKNGRKPLILKQSKTIWGYYDIQLSKNGKNHHERVHRLVAKAFLPNPNNLPQVNHKDLNRLNNHADNLEWCDISYNYWYTRNKTGKNQRPAHKVRCVETGTIYGSAKIAALKLGVSPWAVRYACTGRNNTCKKLRWEYAD